MRRSNKTFALFVIDALLIIFSTYLSVAVRLKYVNVLDVYTGATLFMVLTYLLSFYVFDIYNPGYRFKSAAYLARFLLAIGAATALVAIVFYLFPQWKFGRGILLINTVLIAGFTYSWRLLYEGAFAFVEKPKRVVIVGAGYAGETILNVLRENRNFSVKGFLDDDPALQKQANPQPVLGKTGLLFDMIRGDEVDGIVMAITHDKSPEILKALIQAKMRGVEIYNMAALHEELTGKLPVLHLSDGWMAYTPFHGTMRGLYTMHVKRLLDICLSAAGLLLSLPLSLPAAAAIKLDSKGPVLFRQKRVGYDGQVFELLKFRSMTADAETAGPVWATANDSRVTRVGRIMRKTRIDEIPQMWNVLKGDMSFIGPRPERPEFVEKLKEEIPFYFFRHAVKPGITGWAQVNFRYGASKEDAIEKLQYDLYYIKNLSAYLDVLILLKTIKVVLFGKGAR